MLSAQERACPCLVPSNRTLHYQTTGIVTDPCSAPSCHMRVTSPTPPQPGATLAHAARMQHSHRHKHREVPRRSGGAARKDNCTVCERTVFTPCRRTHSAVDTRRWREEPTSTWPNSVSPLHALHSIPLDTPPACAHADSTMVEAPHYAARSDSVSPSYTLRRRINTLHVDT